MGVAQKADYLASLGINAVELLPVFEWDELEFQRFKNPRYVVMYGLTGFDRMFNCMFDLMFDRMFDWEMLIWQCMPIELVLDLA